MKSSNDGGQLIDDCACPALGYLIVNLCADHSLESICPEKIQKDAELVNWQQEGSLLCFRNADLWQNEIQDKTEALFGHAKNSPEKQGNYQLTCFFG